MAGSVGPTGEIFQPMGNLTHQMAVEIFHEQAEGLKEGGADVLWVETMSAFEEYAAAADETRRDARSDRAWRERILAWYSRPSNEALARAGLQAPNAYGVQDLHGLVWEWTDDFSALLISGDNRNQGDADKAKFCGAGSLSMGDRENYAVLMRVAMLSSLEGADATANLGFRCARKLP